MKHRWKRRKSRWRGDRTWTEEGLQGQESKALAGNLGTVGLFWMLELKAEVGWSASGNGTHGKENAAFRDP